MIKAESVPTLKIVEVVDAGPRESFKIESEDVLKTSNFTPGDKVPTPILLELEYRV